MVAQKHQRIKTITLILGILLLFWNGYKGFQTVDQVLQNLRLAGWDLFLDQTNSTDLLFSLRCLSNEDCIKAFTSVFSQTYPLSLPLATLGVLGLSALFTVLSGHPLKPKSIVGASWSKPKDLKLYVKGESSSPQRGYLGLSTQGNLLRLPERLRCAHTLVIGATGARKSTGYHKPNLLMDARDKVSAIVIDLKYPDISSGFFDMVAVFTQAGHDIQLFLPYGEHTMRLPLLKATGTLAGASEVADMIIPASSHDGAEFYRKQERLLLIGLLMGMAQESNPSLGELFRLLSQGRTAIQSYFHKHPDSAIRERVKGLFDLDARTFAGIVAGLAGELQAFDDGRLERATTASKNPKENIDLETLGLRPTLLYIGIPQEHLQGTKAHVLLKLIKRAIDLSLLKTANAYGGKLPNHTSFYLDEFANLGALPNVSENFATMRSRRVAYHVSLQNRAQGEALYGRDQFRSFFTNNFQQVILFPRSLKFEDAEYFSKALGMQAVLDKAKGSSHEGFFDKRRRSELIKQVAEPLLSLEAMMTWPEAKGILLASGTPPTQILLPRLDEARVLGVKNPLHRFHKRTQLHLKPQLFAEMLVRQQAGFHQESKVEASLLPNLEKLEPELFAREDDSKVSKVEISETKPLQTWIDTLLEHTITTKAHINPRTQKLSKLSLSHLPSQLQKPEHLKVWLEKGWIKLTGDEIGLVGEGLKCVGSSRLEKLKSLEATAPVPAKRKPAKSTLSQEAVSKLRQYIQSNGKLLKGHPDYESLDVTARPQAIGLYQASTLLLDKQIVESFLPEALLKELPMRKEGPQGKQRWVVEITLSKLKTLPELNAWYLKNAHLLKGHPGFQKGGEDAGVYLPETLSLPKQTLEQVLGKVPGAAKASRPQLNGKRPYLMMLELPD